MPKKSDVEQGSKPIGKEKIEQMRFGVCCIHPSLDGAIQLQSKMNRLCGHKHGMTVQEMNEALIWEGQPYIRIPYCKYCNRENTLGVFDDDPQLLGWAIFSPDEENPSFMLVKLDKIIRI